MPLKRLDHTIPGMHPELVRLQHQHFLASLIKKVQSNGVLLNPGKVYPLLNAATKSLTADPGLNSLHELYGLAQRLQKIPTGAIHFVTTWTGAQIVNNNRRQAMRRTARAFRRACFVSAVAIARHPVKLHAVIDQAEAELLRDALLQRF